MTDFYWVIRCIGVTDARQESIYILGHSFGVDDGHITWIIPIVQLLSDPGYKHPK